MMTQNNPYNAVVPLSEDNERHTIVDIIWGHASRQPQKLALVACSLDGTVKRLTYEELANRAEDVAAGLRDHGIVPGDHVAIVLGNAAAYEFVLTELACARLGAVAVLVNPGSKRDELLHVLALTECRAVVIGRETAEEIRALGARLPTLGPIFEVQQHGETGVLDWHLLLEPKMALRESHPRPKPSDDAYIIMTSGTTGKPKAVVLTHANGVAGGGAMARAWGIRAGDIVQTPIPLTTSAGTFVSRLGPFFAGTTLIIDPPFDAEVTFARIRAEGTTVLLVVPAIIIFMADQFVPERHSLDTVRLFCFGSAPITVSTLERVKKLFPWIQLGQIYGMTESSTVGSYLSPDVFFEHVGSIGKPVLCQMRIGDEKDADVAPGTLGQILIRGPSVMKGYHRDPEASASALSDGWLHTGDIGYVDDKGYFFHVDRSKDMIVRGGYKVGSVEVENVLLRHDDVKEAAVVAVPHPKLGEDVFAFAVIRDGAVVDVEDLVQFCREKLVDYKVPRRIVFISTLPRNLAGKIDKRMLRQNAQDILVKVA
ncbi:class I adenylate-forming enzyme family protein [Cupriavidus oxalaticus]|uniref:class I adenylate-forming enzyme family protein n=1 Tax=Cupriavidus oxalaticus TaxID=96344 RepID=UPI00316CBBDD